MYRSKGKYIKMASPKKKKDNLLTGLIIGISLFGIIYFGYISIEKNTKTSRENPFRYPAEKYKTRQDKVSKYIESTPLKTALSEIRALAIGPADKLFVSGSDHILIFNPDMSLHLRFKSEKTANCISVDNNKIYLGMKNHVQVYSLNGVLIARWDPVGSDAYITSIAAAENSVFVADAENRVIWEYSFSGEKIRPIGRKDKDKEIPGFVIPSYYFDVAIDPDGFLWVVNPGRHSLENYTPLGTIRTVWGKYSIKKGGFCGCCNPIHICIRQDGFFITAEKGIARIRVYDTLGDLVELVAGPDKFKDGTKIRDLAVNSLGHIFVAEQKNRSVRIFMKKARNEKGKQVNEYNKL